MLLECSNCGAPLDVQGGARRTKCNYCGQTTQVGKLEKVADETPQGWEPPKQWSPPAHTPMAGQSLVYRPVRAIGRAIALSIRLGIFAIVGTVVWRVITIVNQTTNHLSSGSESAELQGAVSRAIGAMTDKINAADKTSGSAEGSVTCSGSDTLTLSGRTLRSEGAAGVPVTAIGSCRLKLVACRLSGATALIARDNARVTIEGGTMTGAGVAVALSGNAVLDISGGTLITGGPALAAAGNSKATLRDSSVNGAVDTRENASIDATGAKLLGPITGTRRVRK
jgi:LSD1 subclass zinc finger protein